MHNRAPTPIGWNANALKDLINILKKPIKASFLIEYFGSIFLSQLLFLNIKYLIEKGERSQFFLYFYLYECTSV